MNFGCLPLEKDIKTKFFNIKTLSSRLSYKYIKNNWNNYHEGWAYPPLEHYEKKGEKLPVKYCPKFELPPTHNISLNHCFADSNKVAKFSILLFGFFQGLFLGPEKQGALIRVSVKPYSLTSFNFRSEKTEIKCINHIMEKYLSESLSIQKKLFAMIHWYLLSQSYTQFHDKFSNQYQVTDLIYKIFSERENRKFRSHYERIESLCYELEIQTPDWAKTKKNQFTTISKLRNELIHEATIDKEPILYKYPEFNIYFLIRLNELLILRTLGLSSDLFTYPNSVHRCKYLIS